MELPQPPSTTKIKVSKERWLNTPIQYEEDYYMKNIIELMSQKLYDWISSKNDLSVNTDYETFHNKLIENMYQKIH